MVKASAILSSAPNKSPRVAPTPAWVAARAEPCTVNSAMTAPTNALISGDGLRVLAPGERFEASFSVGVAG